jgi:hypothetical protein
MSGALKEIGTIRGSPIEIALVRRIPQFGLQPFKWSCVGSGQELTGLRRPIWIEPSQHIVERAVFEHYHDDVLDLRQIGHDCLQAASVDSQFMGLGKRNSMDSRSAF